MSAPSDLATLAAQAVAAHREGDSGAMGRMVASITPLLWRVARAQGLDATAAEDVVQTTWVRLIEKASSIQDPQATLKWLVTTTRREAWTVGRRARSQLPTDPDDGFDEVPIPGPEEGVVTRAMDSIVWRHVRTLSARCQYLLAMIAFAEHPDYAAVSDALGMPVGSIGPTRGRCLAKLRLALDQDPEWGVTA